jgi:hypothetical protein
MHALRPEVLRHAHPDGRVTLFDPLLERVLTVSAADAAALGGELPAALAARLAGAMLLEGPAAEALRSSVIAARLAQLGVPGGSALATGSASTNTGAAAGVGAPAGVGAAAGRASSGFDPGVATDLPALVCPAWRVPEAWRRLAEDCAAGRTLLVLRGFLDTEFAAALAAEVGSGAFARFATDIVTADRFIGDPGPALSAWLDLARSDTLRHLAGGALGVSLPRFVKWNGWRMGPGDGMRVHPDGRRYSATWALGLCHDWTAADGGAITFGEPAFVAGEPTFTPRERWLPFLGDLCLFAPHATSWHMVEPPRRTRLTLSGWWVSA